MSRAWPFRSLLRHPVALLEPEILPTHYLDLRNKVNINDNDKARTKKSSINKLLMSHREH